MPQFAYRARDAQGSLVEGVLDCPDRAVAIRQIELQKCIPVRIELVGPEAKTAQRDGAAPTAPTRNLKIPHGQLLVFTEQLAHLLQAGMTLDEGLSVLEKRLKQPRVQQMTHSLHQALVDGRSFSQALSELPRIFPPLYVNLVAAGEASGALPQILLRVVKTFDAGQGAARPRAGGTDLSGISRAGWRRSYYDFYHVHGATVKRIHGTNWRRASVAHADSDAYSSCDYGVLVGWRAGGD